MRTFIKPRRFTLKIFFILFCIIITPFYSALKAQNIAITDDDSYIASPSAMLDVKSTTKGLLIPRLTTIQREAINPVATGLLVFDINKNAFYYYDGTEWLALPQVSSSTAISEALFAVKNSAGDTIFAVYNDGVKVVVPYGTKGKVGGFAVSGRSPTKAGEEDYLLVTPDSTRVFINEVDVKGKVGGFAVSGRSPTKSVLKDYFISTSDSTRIYVPEGLFKGKVGGFAVSGRSPTKLGEPNDYFNISGNLQAEKINNESRVMWYPVKAAFLAGEVHVGSADSVGTNSTSLGYRTIAMGNYSQAMGYKAQSLGLNSTAIGNYAIASAENSFALGDSAIARGVGSYAFGTTGLDTTSGTPTTVQTIANGDHSFAFGFGSYAHSIGGVAIGTDAASIGKFSMAFGLNDTAYADFSYALGVNSISSGKYSFTIGVGNQATKRGAYAIGNECIASGQTSFQWVINLLHPDYLVLLLAIKIQHHSVVLLQWDLIQMLLMLLQHLLELVLRLVESLQQHLEI